MCTNMGKNNASINKGSQSNQKITVKQLTNQLPETSDLTINRLEKLTGTPEEIEKIKKFRMGVLQHYAHEVNVSMNSYDTEESSKMVSAIINSAEKGKEEVAKYILSHRYSDGGDKKSVEVIINNVKKLADRIKKVNKLSSQTSARWWIENQSKVWHI